MEITVNGLMEKIMTIPDISVEQFRQIKNILEFELADVQIVTKSYELANVDTNEVYIREYMANLKLTGRSDKTIYQYVHAIRDMLDYINKNISDISKSDLKKYFAWYMTTHRVSATSLLNIQRFITPFFKYLVAEEYIQKNPALNIDKPKVKKPDIAPFNGEELEMIRESSYKVQKENGIRNRALVEFMIATGCRVSEISNCRISDIDFNNKSVKVTGKGNKDRVVFFTGGALKYLKDYLKTRTDGHDCLFYSSRQNKALSKDAIEIFCRNLCNGEIRCNPHRFRHTFAQTCIDRGMAVEDLSHLMGHEEISTTMRYYQKNNLKLQNAYLKYVS